MNLTLADSGFMKEIYKQTINPKPDPSNAIKSISGSFVIIKPFMLHRKNNIYGDIMRNANSLSAQLLFIWVAWKLRPAIDTNARLVNFQRVGFYIL